jgi:hypothetical protein
MRSNLVILVILSLVCQNGLCQHSTKLLHFKTFNGHTVTVAKGFIKYDSKPLLKINNDDILFSHGSNRLIEDHGSVFLFLAVDDNPNKEKYEVYLITPYRAKHLLTSILSPIEDYDHDRYMEFGGSDLTEGYGNADSMYYIPTLFYKIKDGHIKPDMKLTKREDIGLNGIYLPASKRLDKDGNCCVVIPKPNHK